MKSFRLLLSIVLIVVSTAAFAQSDAPRPPSDAQKSFTLLKSLAGTWEGAVKMDGHEHHGSDAVQVSLRVTSRGNALVHEMGELNRQDDPTKYDHPVSMFYIDSDRLLLTHYCDAGNRPRLAARVSEDGKKVEFDYLDLSGGDKFGHMYHAVFTIIDANHHIEEWTYMMPGDKPMHARLDLQRVKQQQASAR